jgi:nicotinate-nucleotide pyrophosphorylase (carboxylating)
MNKQAFPAQEAQTLIRMALDEDVRDGDFTSLWTMPAEQNCTAHLIAKQDGVLAGMDIIAIVYEALQEKVEIELFFKDGERVQKGETIAAISGRTQAMLTGERTILNLMQQLSGVATVTAAYMDALAGSKTVILDTRKTLPGYRLLQKYAVSMGGGSNHRMGLFDMVLIKDNHIQAAGSALAAVQAVQKQNDRNLRIEVEIESLEQLSTVLNQGVDVIMLDNMDKATMSEAVKMVKESGDSVKIEASGNMNLERVADLKDIGLDYISVGAITHSVPAMDISMRIPS